MTVGKIYDTSDAERLALLANAINSLTAAAAFFGDEKTFPSHAAEAEGKAEKFSRESRLEGGKSLPVCVFLSFIFLQSTGKPAFGRIRRQHESMELGRETRRPQKVVSVRIAQMSVALQRLQ